MTLLISIWTGLWKGIALRGAVFHFFRVIVNNSELTYEDCPVMNNDYLKFKVRLS